MHKVHVLLLIIHYFLIVDLSVLHVSSVFSFILLQTNPTTRHIHPLCTSPRNRISELSHYLLYKPSNQNSREIKLIEQIFLESGNANSVDFRGKERVRRGGEGGRGEGGGGGLVCFPLLPVSALSTVHISQQIYLRSLTA
jgi:hypothetical protein